MTCTICGGTLSVTKVCFDCGAVRRVFDTLTFIIGVVGLGLALFPLLPMIVWFIAQAFSLSGTVTMVAGLIARFIPVTVAADAIIMAHKRRNTHKTAVALGLGTAGVAIGLLRFAFFVQFLFIS